MITRRSVLRSSFAMPFVNSAARAETLQPGGGDQTGAIQAAIAAAKDGGVVQFGAGVFEVSVLTINRNVTLQGVSGATRLLARKGGEIFSIRPARQVVVQGLRFTAKGSAGHILTAEGVERLIIQDCDFSGAETAMRVTSCSGRVVGNRFQFHDKIAVQSIDSQGFEISGNRISDIGNCGIQIWQSVAGEDGSLVTNNTIRRIASKDGGNGQNGNGINVYKAGNVTVANNRITDCAFSGIRNNSTANSVITGNSISRCNEVALYVEFNHEGSVVADNLIETVAHGIAIANSDVGGRMAQVTGNVIRNLRGAGAEGLPLGGGIICDADVVVANNLIDKADSYGIRLGWGPFGRNLMASNNVLMNCKRGIDFSTLAEGPYVIANNIISGAASGAVIGMDYDKPVTADLTLPGAKLPTFANITGNMVRN